MTPVAKNVIPKKGSLHNITKILVETASDKWRQLMSVMSLSGGKI